jgi:hypothetical protein
LEGKDNFVCPACQTSLEIMTDEVGLIIVGVVRHSPQRADSFREPAPLPPGDPVVDEYHKWQMRAAFIALSGLAFGIILFMDLKNSYANYGPGFWRNFENLAAVPVLGFLTVVPLVTGVWMYLYAGGGIRERRERVRAEEKSQQ